MSDEATQRLADLKQFLRTIQRPGLSLDNIGVDDNLVESGLIDSLAVVQIVVYLEKTYQIDFSAYGFNPERLSSMSSILQFVEEALA